MMIEIEKMMFDIVKMMFGVENGCWIADVMGRRNTPKIRSVHWL